MSTYQAQFLADPIANKLAPLIGAAKDKDRVRSELSHMAVAMQRAGVDPLKADFAAMAKAVDQ